MRCRQSPLFPKLPSLFNLITETSPLFLVVAGKFPPSDVVLGHARQSWNSLLRHVSKTKAFLADCNPQTKYRYLICHRDRHVYKTLTGYTQSPTIRLLCRIYTERERERQTSQIIFRLCEEKKTRTLKLSNILWKQVIKESIVLELRDGSRSRGCVSTEFTGGSR